MWFVGLNCVADCCLTAGFCVLWCILLVLVVGICGGQLFSVGGWFDMGFGFVVWLVVGLIWILLCLQVAGLVSGCCFVFVVVVVICFWSCVVWVFGICAWVVACLFRYFV